MGTSTVERTKGQIGSEKQDKVVMGREPRQQIKDEQWEFIRDEVEKMKEAREHRIVVGLCCSYCEAHLKRLSP